MADSDMKEIYAIINQKGGVGKSATALALGAGLRLKGYKVLTIDLDPQGNLSSSMAASTDGLTAHELLMQTAEPDQTIQNTEQGDLIPTSPLLVGADTALSFTGKEYRLREAISRLSRQYDYLVIDTPPSLGILTINAMTAATGIIIPAQADVYSLDGIKQLYGSYQVVKTYCNPDLAIRGILLTRHSSRSVLSKDVTEAIYRTAKQLNTWLYKAKIRECVSIKEAALRRADIFTYAPKSNASIDYMAFINELLKRR
jgi:chromosome partitioning protein